MSLEDIRDGTLACDDGHEVQHHESDPVILPHQGFKLLRLGPFSFIFLTEMTVTSCGLFSESPEETFPVTI